MNNWSKFKEFKEYEIKLHEKLERLNKLKLEVYDIDWLMDEYSEYSSKKKQ